ncbi:glycosyl hydrolase 115 family protein [Marinoscillum sp. MHG1-6]|uniref:glycosyl hydrolase 115 family protein n=1 Tax=Marinoscillum sp. MHG1-6 TaxID=2959627 RepID=UPI00215862AA|nr:glycosyl hydrolase 115 family protein [Marinoscillum sp. MHG1-6]
MLKKNIFRIIGLILISVSCADGVEDSKFVITKDSKDIRICVDQNADDLVKWAAKELSDDMEDILGRKVPVVLIDDVIEGASDIYIGTIEDKLVQGLSKNYLPSLQGKWENFVVDLDQRNLAIVGSDIRGTLYGVFDLAEKMGISPSSWWADVVPTQNDSIVIDMLTYDSQRGPSVQFRGIFLNDEDWGLQPWAAHTFEPETGDIGPKTYEKIFQLLLRLKANTIWPAMHPSTQAFFKVSGNRKMAEKYHIVVGTSHAEPMLRNNVDEWDHERYGEFNYFTNEDGIKSYWQERVEQTKNGDYLYTVGMRGIHDSGMEGEASREEKIQMLEKVIEDQRTMLSNTLGKSAKEVPQVFVAYKEVLELYDNGLLVPEDITLMWSDDNYGYIRRLSDQAEQKREGGSGVYYHLSYWGRPHDYLWLSTTQPGLIWYEMTRAFQNGAKKIWIANVGDIKPAEYNMEFFLDLAWDVNSISEETIHEHLVDWASREFGNSVGKEVAGVMDEYYRLAFLRKPEYMGWSQTEPTTSTRMTGFTTSNNNEIQRRIDAYMRLVHRVESIKSKLVENRDAFFQLVEYPVKCAAFMNHKFLYAQQSAIEKDEQQKSMLNLKVQLAFDSIVTLTEKYNKEISDGKWDHMMSMKPRELPVFDLPEYHLADEYPESASDVTKSDESTPVFIQGSDYSEARSFDNYVWKTIAGLGYSMSGVTLYPFEHKVFSQESPYLEYNFEVKNPGSYLIRIRCLPTHSNDFNHKIWIETDKATSESISLNTKGRSTDWKVNVLRNYQEAAFPVNFERSGEQRLRVYINQTGIVIDQISVNPIGYPEYYEIPNKD